MSHIPLGVPVEIDGHEVIVFRDRIGSDSLRNSRESEVFTVIEQATADGRPAIYIDEHELRQVREDYPGINVYGLWQILFFNNKVPLGNEVVVYPMGKGNGAYIRLDKTADMESPSAIVASSEYVDNFITELIDFDIEQANRVEVEIGDLRLPPHPAYTRLELFEKQKYQETKRWYLVGAVCAALAVGTGILNYTLHTVYKKRLAEYQTKQTLLGDLDARIATLNTERLAQRPDDGVMLGKIFRVFQYDPQAITAESDGLVVGFANEHKLLTSPFFPIDLSKQIEGVTAELNPYMQYKLVISPVNGGAGG